MTRKRIELPSDGLKLERRNVIYLDETVKVEEGSRLYLGKPIVKVSGESLNVAYGLLQTFTDQHLKPERSDRHLMPPRTRGISEHFHYQRGLEVYAYGPESLNRIRHLKFSYDAALPLLELIDALRLPSPGNAVTIRRSIT